MNLIDVYKSKDAPQILWKMMKVRLAESKKDKSSFVNVLHRRMPSWREHLAFIRSRKNGIWYLIQVTTAFFEQAIVGWIYLSPRDEIGVVLFPEFRGMGFGEQAITEIMREHKRKRYLANINPENARSVRLFSKFGFKLIANLYARDGK